MKASSQCRPTDFAQGQGKERQQRHARQPAQRKHKLPAGGRRGRQRRPARPPTAPQRPEQPGRQQIGQRNQEQQRVLPVKPGLALPVEEIENDIRPAVFAVPPQVPGRAEQRAQRQCNEGPPAPTITPHKENMRRKGKAEQRRKILAKESEPSRAPQGVPEQGLRAAGTTAAMHVGQH